MGKGPQKWTQINQGQLGGLLGSISGVRGILKLSYQTLLKSYSGLYFLDHKHCYITLHCNIYWTRVDTERLSTELKGRQKN